MVNISLTDFVDFVVSSGTPKLTKVKTVMLRGEYHPAFDFWKTLRDGIVEYHARASGDKKHFDRLLESVSEGNRKSVYPTLVANYKSFLGRKTIIPGAPPRALWEHAGLEVRVNPELLLKINDKRHLIKLYFKADQLSKNRIEIIQLLLQRVFDGDVETPIKFCVLDVRHNKIYATEKPDAKLMPLLQGEAVSFVAIWKSLSQA
jgi:hypothetical protein